LQRFAQLCFELLYRGFKQNWGERQKWADSGGVVKFAAADSSCNGQACDGDSGIAVAATSPISLSSNLPLFSDIEAANLQQMTYRKINTTHDVNTFAPQAQLCPSRLQASAIHAPHAVPRIFAPNLKTNARQRVGHTAPADKGLKKLNSHKT
jgi:hypothetical protein